MRKLTVKRRKRFVACLATMFVWLESADGDVRVNGRLCKKIGELKNGEEKSFEIGEEAAALLITASTGKSFSGEIFFLPAGSEDVTLSGENKFDPAAGNAFRIDENTGEAVKNYRKKSTRLGALILICAILLGAVAGYLISSFILRAQKERPKEFSADGMTIRLTGEFRPQEEEGFTAVYLSKKVTVMATKESYSEVPSPARFSLSSYAEYVAEINRIDKSAIRREDGLTYTAYERSSSSDGETYSYTVFFYQAADAFWLIQFATEKGDADAFREKIFSWAKSVSFADEKAA